MKTAIPVMLAIVLASGVSAPALAAGANNPQDLINIEAAWAKAVVTRDAAALNHIVAADWTGQNERGKMYNRATMVQHTVAGQEKLSAMTNHDVHVRFMGNDHAIVQGMDNETGTTNGKTVHEVYSWTDVYEKRGGQWVAIASQNTPIK
jgi:uncharacterized protein (TIGR02246 family)